MAGDHGGSVARHRRPSALRTGVMLRGRAACAAGVIMVGTVFGVSAAAPQERATAERRPTEAVAAPPPARPQPSLAARGQRRAAPVVNNKVVPLAQAPKASPSPTPTQAPSPEPAPAPPPVPQDAPEDCDAYSGNRLIACAMLADYGFGVDQMPALDNLWTRESGWNERAQNPSSGAYGIPQALPGEKMASCGDDWRTNPATQICWGLGYIKDRYGGPNGAWAFFQANGWY